MKMDYESMSESEMVELLLEFAETPMFQAALSYAFRRDKLINDALRSLDPFKEPTSIARNQGISIGLFDLRDYILIKQKQAAEQEKEGTK